jgi:hypothetical protein
VESPVTYESHQVVCHAFTWHREKHSLFDTEANDDKLTKFSTYFSKENYLTRKDKSVQQVPTVNPQDPVT